MSTPEHLRKFEESEGSLGQFYPAVGYLRGFSNTKRYKEANNVKMVQYLAVELWKLLVFSCSRIVDVCNACSSASMAKSYSAIGSLDRKRHFVELFNQRSVLRDSLYENGCQFIAVDQVPIRVVV